MDRQIRKYGLIAVIAFCMLYSCQSTSQAYYGHRTSTANRSRITIGYGFYGVYLN